MKIWTQKNKKITISDWRRHVLLFLFLCIGTVTAVVLYFVNLTNEFVYMDSEGVTAKEVPVKEIAPFPIGVNPKEKSIQEMPEIDRYLTEELVRTTPTNENTHTSFLRKAVAKLALLDWYQSLAAGSSRILIIQPGERKEQIATNFAKILKWDDDGKREFLASVISSEPILLEGKFAPGSYITANGAAPSDIAPLISDRFNETIMARYNSEISEKVSLQDALTIASLLEREAYDFDDMRYIAGVIWNRLFIGMNLQIDATLQYAKGAQAAKTWWPIVVPNDKYIKSPYNTYAHKGLPPTPIASPSVDAVLAALNPRETTCMYYFHDKDSKFHCSETYPEHVQSLKKYYGQGR